MYAFKALAMPADAATHLVELFQVRGSFLHQLSLGGPFLLLLLAQPPAKLLAHGSCFRVFSITAATLHVTVPNVSLMLHLPENEDSFFPSM